MYIKFIINKLHESLRNRKNICSVAFQCDAEYSFWFMLTLFDDNIKWSIIDKMVIGILTKKAWENIFNYSWPECAGGGLTMTYDKIYVIKLGGEGNVDFIHVVGCPIKIEQETQVQT